MYGTTMRYRRVYHKSVFNAGYVITHIRFLTD